MENCGISPLLMLIKFYYLLMFSIDKLPSTLIYLFILSIYESLIENCSIGFFILLFTIYAFKGENKLIKFRHKLTRTT